MTWGWTVYVTGMATFVVLNDWEQTWRDFIAGCQVLARWLWP